MRAQGEETQLTEVKNGRVDVCFSAAVLFNTPVNFPVQLIGRSLPTAPSHRTAGTSCSRTSSE